MIQIIHPLWYATIGAVVMKKKCNELLLKQY